MDVLIELKNRGGKSLHHTQSTSPTTQETLPVSPQNPNAHPSHIRKYSKYSEYLELAGPALIRKYSEIFGNIRKYSFPNQWETLHCSFLKIETSANCHNLSQDLHSVTCHLTIPSSGHNTNAHVTAVVLKPVLY